MASRAGFQQLQIHAQQRNGFKGRVSSSSGKAFRTPNVLRYKGSASPAQLACRRRGDRSGKHVVSCTQAPAQQDMEDGVTIRRCPPAGTGKHSCGPDVQFYVPDVDNEPKNILEEIVWSKVPELERRKELLPLMNMAKMVKIAPPPMDFIGALRAAQEKTGKPGLIAEVKKASPSKGVIQPDFDPVKIAQAYEAGGAACLSVLTDEKFFQGSFDNLKYIREAGVQCPLLCKEFIVDAYQIMLARAKGASAVLLIAAVLPNKDLIYLMKCAEKLGMQVLVEVHTAEEMERVLKIEEIKLLGINNRNLETFEVSLDITKELLDGPLGDIVRERDILMVGESGIFTPEHVKFVQDAGVGSILVGESLVRENDPETAIKTLLEL
eukprot:CAMPEP_0197848426 /NCGR_PEP_ID=MMETSP1438-20131217/8699_1 /TAXON_ID=1461541 /ORGANISM="Pterosperma sp., Strain CCMP1384" /LENGTH=379 /DNA_ID=CAMNT_0043460667 /DNA_START=119 /DNA_END=1258 /DNA_ORIENTATION=-